MGRRTAEQLDESRGSILSAAEKLFAMKGFAQTQVAEIADRAGVGIGSFYRQFSDKEELLSVILGGLFGDIRRKLLAMRSGMVDRTPLEQLMVIQKTFEIVFGVFAENPAVTLTMLKSGYGMSRKIEKLVWNALNDLAEDVEADAVRAGKAGLLNLERPRFLGDVIVGMVLHLSHRMLVDGSFTAMEAAWFCTRFTIGGLMAYVPREVFRQVSPLVLGLQSDSSSAATT